MTEVSSAQIIYFFLTQRKGRGGGVGSMHSARGVNEEKIPTSNRFKEVAVRTYFTFNKCVLCKGTVSIGTFKHFQSEPPELFREMIPLSALPPPIDPPTAYPN